MSKKYTFTEEEKAQVEAAVKELETVSCGEMVPYFVQSSDDYDEASWYFASLLPASGLIITAVLSYFWLLPIRFSPLEWSLALSAIMVIGYVLPIVFPVMKRWVISKEKQKLRVEQRAYEAFLKEGVFNTQERVGILIFVSRLEHQVLVIGDQGINAKVKPEDWQHIVEIIVDGIKAKAIGKGFSEAILACKDLLLGHGFTRKTTDFNELSDGLRIGD